MRCSAAAVRRFGPPYSELHITMAKDEWNALEDKDKVSIYLEPDTILVMDR